MNAQDIASIVRNLKGLIPGSKGFWLPIKNELGVQVGALIPIDFDMASQPAVVSSLTKWRKMFMKYFLTQFDATDERTQAWLTNVVLPDNSKILFLIQDETGKSIGNYAVRDISPDGAELDNLIRGEKGGDPKLVFYAELTLLKWLYDELKIPRVTLRVLSGNLKTLALHQSVGFKEVGRTSIRKIKTADGFQYETNPSSQTGNGDSQLLMFELNRDDFHRINNAKKELA
jgi:hypothetical protein